jgi:hypothetical protein
MNLPTALRRGLAPLAFVVPMAAESADRGARYTAYTSAEAHADDERPLHGVLLLAYERRLGDHGGAGRFGAEFNTDTLRFDLADVPVDEHTTLNARLTGELYIAGLSTDYWQDLEHRRERTFRSSYVQAQGFTKTRIGAAHYVEVELGVRRWFFDENGDETGADFILPPEVTVLEPRLRYTYWGLADDGAWRERHRLYPRLRGFAAGVEGGVDLRTDATRWGDPGDTRNRPRKGIARLRPWAMGGTDIAGPLRWQGTLEAGAAAGDDDLGRRRVGGLTPYVAPIPGVFWAHTLSDRYAHAQVALPVRAFGEAEIGPIAAAAVVNDRGRTGRREAYDEEWGVGLAADLRLGHWQVDVRGGYSPSLSARASRPAATALLGVGWSNAP